MLSCADAVIGSLTKDFCVNKGGIIATNDVKLFHRLQELVHEEGGGIDLIDRKLIALSLQNRKQIETESPAPNGRCPQDLAGAERAQRTGRAARRRPLRR